MKNDISHKQDIDTLIRNFYTKARVDELIGKFFNEVIEINWNLHIPKIVDFWDSILLGETKYEGNPMTPHFILNEKEPLLTEHFNQWILLFNETVDENFSGEIAEDAKRRAKTIANLMDYKIKEMRK